MKFLEDTAKEQLNSFFQEFRSELLLLVISATLIIVSLALFIRIDSKKPVDAVQIKTNQDENVQGVTTLKKTIFVDGSGAV